MLRRSRCEERSYVARAGAGLVPEKRRVSDVASLGSFRSRPGAGEEKVRGTSGLPARTPGLLRLDRTFSLHRHYPDQVRRVGAALAPSQLPARNSPVTS